MPKLSIIVPVYNCEKHLERCIGSVLKQDFKDYELLLVDDGSTDNSGKIADDYADDNQQIRVIHQANQGVSNARNTGLLEASGEYVMFADADDYLLPAVSDVLENEQLSDLTCLSFEVGKNLKKITGDYRYQGDTSEDAKVMMLENPTQYMTVWSKIFKREIIEQHKLRFNTSLRVAEDGDFMLRYLLNIDSIQFLMQLGYHYSNDVKSVMSTFDHKNKDYLNALMASQRSLGKISSRMQKAFAVYVLMHLNIMMVHETFASANPLKYSERINELKQILKEPIFEESLTAIKVSDCHGARMLPIIFLKMHAYRLASILFILRAKQNEGQVNE